MHYRVRLDPRARQLDVALEIERPSSAAGDLALAVPTWVPGAYAFMKYGRDVFDVRAEDAATRAPLVVRRSGMSGFVVENAPSSLVVRARITAADNAWGELVGVVGHQVAVVRSSHFLFDPAHRGACSVAIEVPEGWELHPPSGAKRLGEHAFQYESFAAFLDSPLVLGRFDRYTRSLRGVTFHHVFTGRAVGFDSQVERFIDEVMAIAAACADVFGGFPFEEYTFVYATDPRHSWGLEHPNATLMGIGDSVFIDDEEHKAALRLAAHELFHAWNVCRLKPKALVDVDLVKGSFPDGLWISEGFTRYYELLLATRVGALTPARFLSNVVRYDAALRALPATRHVTLVDSSLATFLNHNRYPGASSATIDYYDKGMVVAFAIDACLRTAKTPSSLDVALRDFYAAFATSGFTTRDAIRFFEEIAAPLEPREPLGAMLERVVVGPAMPDTHAWLAHLGVETQQGTIPHLGLWLERDRGPAVTDVAEGSPAAQAGIGAGDAIVGVDGYAFRADALRWLVRHQGAFSLTLESGHVRREARVTPAPREVVVAASLPQGGAALAPWLGDAAASLAPGAAIPLSYYDNFHARESML